MHPLLIKQENQWSKNGSLRNSQSDFPTSYLLLLREELLLSGVCHELMSVLSIYVKRLYRLFFLNKMCFTAEGILDEQTR